MSETHHKVQQALENGKLLPEFMEEHRFLPESHEASRNFTATMERVHERLLTGLLGKNYSKKEHAVKFMLSVDKGENAFIYTNAKPPVIGFTTGLVDMCTNESELAAVLGHELGHDYFRKMLGPHVNGKLEELGSDLRVPYMLRQAGYPQEAMRTVIQKFPESLPDFLATLTDPHPRRTMRISALQTAERALVRGKFGMGEQGTVKDSAIGTLKQITNSASFTSHIDKLLLKHGYKTASVEKKIGILQDLIKHDLARGDPYFQSRIADVATQIRALSVNPVQHKAAVDSLLQTILKDSTGSDRLFYQSLQHACGIKTEWHVLPPIGSLADVDHAIRQFTQARQPDAVKAAAKQLNTLAANFNFNEPYSLLSNINFSKFSMPKEEALEKASHANPIVPSWDIHVRTALDSKDEEIAKALTRLGVAEHDVRLKPFLADVGKTPIISGAVPQTSLHLWKSASGPSGRQNIRFDQHGQITGYKDMGKAALYADELALKTQQSIARTASEEAALKNANWAELEKDFFRFVRVHDDHLIPPTSIVGGEHPFAKEFVKQCQALITKDPDTYRPLVHAYFTAGSFESHPTIARAFLSADRHAATPELRVHHRGIGMAPDHPFVNFMVDDPTHLFAAHDKIAMLGATRYYDMNPASTAPVTERWLVDSAKIVQGTPARTIPELEAWVGKVKASQTEHMLDHNGRFLSDLIQFETLRTLEHVKVPATLGEIRFIRELASFNPDAESSVARALFDKAAQLTTEYAKTAKPSAALPELLNEFKILAAERSGSSYFPPIFTENPQLRVKYQQAIQDAMQTVTDPAQKAQALEALLFRDALSSPHTDLLAKIAQEAHVLYIPKKYSPFLYDGGLPDPEFKKWATTHYATSIAESLGADNGSAAYAEKFKAAVERIAAEAPGGNALPVFTKLGTKECGNTLLLSETAAHHLKNTIEKTGVSQLVKYNFHAAVGETALQTLGSNYETREAAIDFLTKPFSNQNAEKFIKKAEKALNQEDKNKFLSEALSAEAKIEQMELFHKNFWSLPFEGRILAAKQILFDAAGHTNEIRGIEQNVRFVLDKVMPHTNGGNRTEVRRSRQVIESYLQATKNLEDKRIITSAMLVANAPNGATAGEKLSVGKGLNLVLSAIDPAGEKVKQAIESHPDTPAHIKAEFKNAKTMAKDPPSYEWHDWVRESNLHCAEHARITPGKVLGAGSYGLTVEGIRPNGEKVARTILYPHVREKAENEFTILGDATEHLIQKNKIFTPVKEMVRQAHRMSSIETDMEMAAKQAKTAAQLYDGMKVTVGGKPYTFSAAKYRGHGVDHKDFEIIEGLHFNDLAGAAKTAEETAHVKGLAKASITAELFNILGGRPFDHDRHGGQQKIIDTHLGQFDFGAMTVTQMSAREKQMIGYVLGGTIKQHYVKEVPIAAALRTEINRVATTEAEKDFLCSVERGLLALGNFQSQVHEDELGEIIGAVFTNDKASPEIKKAMEQRLGNISSRVFKELEAKGKASGITIEALEHQFAPSADTSPLKPPPKETLLERIPLKNEHIIGGAGAAAGFAGFGMLWHANHRVAQKKEKGEEITGLDRTEQIGGGVLGVGGTAIAVDGFAYKGKGLKSITGFKEKIAEESLDAMHTAEGKVHFGKATSLVIGAAVIGGAALYTLSHRKKKDETTPPQEKSWADRVDPKSADVQQPSVL